MSTKTQENEETWHKVPNHLVVWSVLYDACGLDGLSSRGIAHRVGAHEDRLMTRAQFGSMFAKEAAAHCAGIGKAQSRQLGDACFHAVDDRFDCTIGLLFRVSRTSDRP